jgi:S1-C subfamily serine protease
MLAALALAHAINSSVIVVDSIDASTYSMKSDKPIEKMSVEESCSGFVVQISGYEEIVVTARHCMQPDQILNPFTGGVMETDYLTPKSVEFHDGDVGTVESFYPSPFDDVGVLLVRSHHRQQAVATPNRSVKLNEDLFVYGMPDGFDWAISRGYAMQGPVASGTSIPGFESWVSTYLFSCASCGPGDSGGAVWDYSGRVVGVEVAGGDDGENLLVPIAQVQYLLSHLSAVAGMLVPIPLPRR